MSGYTDTELWEEIARLREFGEHYSGAAQDAWDRIAVLEATLEAVERERDEAQALLGVARNQRDAWKQTVVARTKDAAAAERRADEVEKALARVTSYRKHDPATASPERIRSFDSDHDDAEALLATAVVSADSLAAVPIYGGSTDDGHTFDLASPESAEARVAALEAALVEVGGGWRDAETPPCYCRGDITTESLARCTRIRNLLTPAGSASPGGAET